MENTMIEGRKIWSSEQIPDREKSRVELTSLVRYKDYWYCGFREGEIHYPHPSGRARIIRSRDGESWETATIFDWDCADVREPRFSITAEGMLMVNTSIYFTSREPRTDGGFVKMKGGGPPTKSDELPSNAELADQPYYFYQLDSPRIKNSDKEETVARQSVTWLSSDGVNWSSAYACPTGVNLWRWDVSWHNGMGYSVGYNGMAANGILYRTRDGKSWRILKENLRPPELGCGEASLVFGDDNSAYCLLRHNALTAFVGIGEAPYYQNWTWKKALVDWDGDGKAKPAEEVFKGVNIGGPTTIRLSDGRFLAAGRALVPELNDGRIVIFLFDPPKATMTKVAVINGGSYGGICEHDREIWISYRDQNAEKIMLAKIPVP